MPSDNSGMLHAKLVHRQGAWRGPVADSVLLDFEDRHRRRFLMSGVGGLQFLLDLPQAQHLRCGDAVELEDGRLIAIKALPEQLIEAMAHDASGLARLAWHIGNRHLPVEITRTALRIRADKVIKTMLEGLGARLQQIEAPFDPESHANGAEGSTPHSHEHHS